jgi:dTDP-4-amino-4,6-dideoxygalactose transaminase
MMTDLKLFLSEKHIQDAVHYPSLDQSIYWKKNHSNDRRNKESLRYNNCLLRLPLYNSMTIDEADYIISSIFEYFNI